MLEEPDLFISLNTCGGGSTSVNSVCSGVTTLKRDGTMRHSCPSSGKENCKVGKANNMSKKLRT